MKDFTYLSLGGGVQSSAIAEMIALYELPPVDLVLFADTGDEPDYVYQQVEYLFERLRWAAVPCETVTIGNMIEHIYTAGRRIAALPVFTVQNDGKIGKMRRQCTGEYKISPIEKRIRQHLLKRGMARQYKNGAIHTYKGIEVECWLGISVDEAIKRMKPNKIKWIENRWPLVEKRMSRHDCKLWLEKNGLPIPKKSSCRVCPFHNDAHWRWMKDERPEDWNHVVKFDDWIRNGTNELTARSKGELFLHKQCVPMPDVDLTTLQDLGQGEMFDECDEGYCYI